MAKKKSTVVKETTNKKVSEDAIRKKAQAIYEERMRNRTPGNADSDWIQAEKELGIN